MSADQIDTPEMRELIGELRRINDMTGEYSMVRKALSDLLRRIDRESQEETR